ncbi:MAG: acyltransferase family protein [Reichenbachiella sp.]|uniref:acyltransferase family protein n=1 Tax=Reichenbachiella sp. TaxID=2184521 RepID=UPI0029676BEB|nr:acyltransferase family protein [Reichenbachiella sp.]MDW3211415.1 acyltransferase family protein [Reichenbachiella sp.]
MSVGNRRYDIDWLRVIAIGLLLIYHIAIGFQPWGVFIGFIQNNEAWEGVWVPMSMLNVWRIPLLFFVSGMGVYFAIQRRDWKQLLVERSKRILIPFVFGMLAIVPLHVLLWQEYYHQDKSYVFNPAHLWFLGNIFIYVLVLSPLFFYLKRNKDGVFQRVLQKLFSTPAGLLVIMLPFVLEAVVVQPDNFEMYAMTMHGFWLGLVAFLVGFCCVYSGATFWNTVTNSRWVLLLFAVGLYTLRLILFELKSPDFLMAIESNFWIFTVFGFGHKYLNKPSQALTYLSQAAYPIYIIHMVFLYLGSMLLFAIDLSATIKFWSLVLFTNIACYLTYEFVIRRVKILRPLFGLKT